MKVAQISRPGRLAPIFLSIAALTVAGTLLTYWLGLRVTAANRWIVQNQEAITALADLLSTLKDAETGQRGFLLTGDERYLQPYAAAVQRVDAEIAQVEHWAEVGEVATDGARAVARLTREKLAELNQTITMRRQKGMEAATALVQSDVGKRIMDDLRRQIGQMEDQERAERIASRNRRDAAAWLRTLVAIEASLVTLGFLPWAFRRIRQAIGDIERQKQLLGVTLASIGDGVIVTDRQGRVTFLNGEAERLTGWNLADAQGQELHSVFPIINEQTREPVESPVEKVLRLGTIVGLANHTILIARDGRETPIDDSGAPVREPDGTVLGVVLVFRDFSEQKKAEAAMRESEERLRTMADSMPQLAWTAHADGFIHWYNRRWYDYTGTTPPQMEGWGWQSVHDPKTLPEVLERWKASIATGEPFEMVFPLRGADGRFRPFLTRGQPLKDAQGRVVQWFGTNTDVEQLKRAEEALAAAKAAAETASKAKDQFLAVLSHELRTPLTPVVATVSMLQQDPRFDADTRESLQMIQRNVELEARLIDDLLDVTRIERGKIELDKQPVELETVLRHAAEVCMPDIAARKLKFGIDAADGPYMVDADPVRLRQVLWNLLKNAIKFTPEGGRVGIRCRKDGAGGVLAEVNDSGEGIDPEVLPRLFNAFEQGGRQMTRRFGGLGLGLAISKAIVDLHGGTLTAHSQGKGKGATFALRLPLLPAKTSVSITPATPEASPAGITTPPLRILLVEDHGDTVGVMRRLLMSKGHQVQVAGDVATALKLAAESPFDLLLSDLGLPDGSGHDLMRTLRQRGLTLPGIALSGYGQETDLQASREAGFAAHLVKPVNPARLAEAIARVAERVAGA